MSKRTTLPVLAGLLAATLVPSCRESVSPERRDRPAAAFAAAASGIELDQQNGALGPTNSTVIRKGFNDTNPRLGSAIIATFYWLGSTNIIPTVSDLLADGTPVGNTYHLVTNVSADNIAMATFVATNVQNFPEGTFPTGEKILVVEATFSAQIADGGVLISSYTGVDPVFAQAFGGFAAASGSGSAPTIAHPGHRGQRRGARVWRHDGERRGWSHPTRGLHAPQRRSHVQHRHKDRWGFRRAGQRRLGRSAVDVGLRPGPPRYLAGERDRTQPGAPAGGDAPRLHRAAKQHHRRRYDLASRAGRRSGRRGRHRHELRRFDHHRAGHQPRRRDALRNEDRDGGEWRRHLLDPEHRQRRERLHARGHRHRSRQRHERPIFNIAAPPQQVRVQTSGGGRIDPAIGKTTFGFNVDSRSGPPFQGEMQVVYHGGTSSMTRIHSLVIDGLTSSPDPRGGVCITWRGSARINNSDQRRFTATACDNGQPGSSHGTGPDRFGISVDGSISTGLTDLKGGNTHARQ